MWRKRNSFALLVGMQTGATTVESSMEIPQKIEYGSAFWPRNPTSGHISGETQNNNLKKHKHPYVHCSVIYNHQHMEAAQVSMSRRVDKQLWDLYIMDYYSAVKKMKKITSYNSMDRPREHYAKWNTPVKGRQVAYDFTHLWNLTNKLNWQGKWGQNLMITMLAGGGVKEWKDWSKRKKDSWTWTAVWWLWGGREYKGTKW